MARSTIVCKWLLIGLSPFGGLLVHARDLSFEARVVAERAIELVYHTHRIGSDRAFEDTLSRELLERKVREYLRQSAALVELWNVPVTAESLERELARIATDTQMPERLGEVFEALGNDAFLVQECFVRPILVERLTRNL